MKVLFISRDDHANMGYVASQALQKIGIESTATIRRKERFGYPAQGIEIENPKYLKPYAEEADVIIFMHDPKHRHPGIDLKDKKVLVWHTGSGYRQKFEKYNAFFNPIVDVSLCSSDLLGLGAKNERCLNGLVDTETLQPDYRRRDNKLIIAHYPSHAKGAENILAAIQWLERGKFKDSFIFKYDGQRVCWTEQIERMSECDIYISEIVLVQRDKIVGHFGITALEAAALGKVSITRSIFPEDCSDFPFGIQVANTPEELAEKLEYLISLPNDELLKLRKLTRDWVVHCHSYGAVGRRLLKIIEEI